MDEPPTIDLDDFRAHMTAHSARAPIVQWMIRNYDEIAPILTGARVQWAAVAAYLAEHGFRNARGTSPSARNVQRAWGRARMIVARQNTPKPRAGRKSPPATTTPEADNSAPADQQAGATEPVPPGDAPATPKFKLARARDEHLWGPASKPPEAGATHAPQPPNPAYAGLSPDQLIDKVLGRNRKDAKNE